MRQEYGGERPYIEKTCEADLATAARRNVAIRCAWKQGEPIALIAQRHGLSRMQVYRIVRGM